jgi:hypothetical protein
LVDVHHRGVTMTITGHTRIGLALAAAVITGAMIAGWAKAEMVPSAEEASSPAPAAADAPAAEAPDTLPQEQDVAVVAEAPDTQMSGAALPGHVPSDGIRRRVSVVGEIVGHPAGKVLLSVNDVVTLSLDRSDDLVPHQRFAIARRAQFVEHPDNGRNMGYLIRVVGTVELEEAFGRYWTGRILSSTDYMTVEDWVIPFETATESASPAAGEVTGRIVAVRDDLVLTAESQLVFTDLGAEQGVVPGDEFRIIREASRGKHGAPDRVVGSLRVVATQPTSSAGSITRSNEPIEIGDRLERATSPAPAPH